MKLKLILRLKSTDGLDDELPNRIWKDVYLSEDGEPAMIEIDEGDAHVVDWNDIRLISDGDFLYYGDVIHSS